MRDKEIKEGLADLADLAERDHEVQMARAELYKIAKYAIKLHDMLKGVSEEAGLEGWVQSKITKSSDYISSVYHHLDYEAATGEINDDEVSVEVGEGTVNSVAKSAPSADKKAKTYPDAPASQKASIGKNAGKTGVKAQGGVKTEGTTTSVADQGTVVAKPKKNGTVNKVANARMTAKKPGMKNATEDTYKSNLSSMLERKLSKGESKKKEKYVKGMKKAKGDFKDRYGKDAEAVMYATATKMAKKK